jgi:hypothetical protein
MRTKFLFMDEKFADKGVPLRDRATSLTGVLIESSVHQTLRSRFYDLVHRIVGDEPGSISPMPMIHAMNLFPEESDEVRLRFLEALVGIVLDLDIRIFRVGYKPTPEFLNVIGGKESVILGMCFSGILSCLESEPSDCTIWPVMEIDRNSPDQDRAFAGLIQNIDYMTQRLGGAALSIRNDNIGELLYVTKRSAYGSIVDCIVYLLHVKYLRLIAQPLTAFKSQLADIAMKLEPAIDFDEVIEMKFEPPPVGRRPTGPFRYMFPIIPKD